MGCNVKMQGSIVSEHFIVEDDTHLGNCSLHHCYVGEGCRLDGGFSAHDSLIFANSNLSNGEASAAFLGPYTVSMHRSTLLIGGAFSFFNAGSGTNQSNHQYRLGPIHHGLMERGVKCSSDSYMLWPSPRHRRTSLRCTHKRRWGNANTTCRNDWAHRHLERF